MNAGENLNYRISVKYSELTGDRSTESEIIQIIKSVEINQMLYLACLALNYLEQEDMQQTLKPLYLSTFEKIVIKRMSPDFMIHKRSRIIGYQTLYMLIKWIVAFGEENRYQIKYDFGMFLELCLRINDFLPEEEIEKYRLEYLFTNLVLNNPKNIGNSVARSFALYCEYRELIDAREISDDFKVKFEETKGYTIENHIGNMFTSLSSNSRDGWNNVIPLPFNPHTFLQKDRVGFKKTIQDNTFRQDIHKKWAIRTIQQPWDYSKFFEKPLIQSSENRVMPLSWQMIEYALSEGLFWNIAYIYSEEERKKYFIMFGKIFEGYITRIIENINFSIINIEALPEFSYKLSKDQNNRSSDYYFKIGNKLLIVEMKSKSPDAAAFLRYDNEMIYKAVNNILVDPINQVLERTREIICQLSDTNKNKDFFRNIDEVFILIVSREKVQPIKPLYQYALNNSYINEESPDVSFDLKSMVTGFANVDIQEFENICKIIEDDNDIYGILKEYYTRLIMHDFDLYALPWYSYVSDIGLSLERPDFVCKMLSENLNRILEGMNAV